MPHPCRGDVLINLRGGVWTGVGNPGHCASEIHPTRAVAALGRRDRPGNGSGVWLAARPLYLLANAHVVPPGWYRRLPERSRRNAGHRSTTCPSDHSMRPASSWPVCTNRWALFEQISAHTVQGRATRMKSSMQRASAGPVFRIKANPWAWSNGHRETATCTRCYTYLHSTDAA